MRANRSGLSFCLLALDSNEPSRSLSDRDRLLGILQDRLRLTDEFGFLPDRRIGVVLPDTPAAGAWKVARDVSYRFDADRQSLRCHVYVYRPDPPQRRDHDDPFGNAESDEEATQTLDSFFEQELPAWKRTADIVGAVIGLIVLSPLMLLAGVAVWLTSPGPVLFLQRRAGVGGRPFRMVKFRTMCADAERRKASLLAYNQQDGPAFKLDRDPRVTTVGRFLRATSIDELPQLWNVLRGEMSLVGPRPLPCDESSDCRGWEKQRLDVTPGMTCIWQIKGRAGVPFADWMRMDVRYVRSRSFWHDTKLLLMTIPAVLSGKGAK